MLKRTEQIAELISGGLACWPVWVQSSVKAQLSRSNVLQHVNLGRVAMQLQSESQYWAERLHPHPASPCWLSTFSQLLTDT